MRHFGKIIAAASLAIASFNAVPVQAHEHDGGYGYDQQDSRYDRYQGERDEDYRDYRPVDYRSQYYGYPHGRHGYARYHDYRAGADYRPYRYARRCHSGTTGAILGAVVGGLLGREIGRGGPYNEPSTTGLLLGAGGGALAGRAIERDGCH